MPTDPRNKDTDGDGLDDGKEGKNWAGSYTINRWGQDNNRSKNTSTISGVQYHIIYGNPKASSDSPCVRGGGLNPCSIDTDSDGLPDLWEHQNAGLLFLNDEIATEDNSGEGVYVFPPLEGLPNASVYDDIRAAVSALGWDRTIYTNDVYHIIMGMDGTSSDAYTKTGLKDHDLDWDGDGLQNWQEYMVQAMRQFRYDDDRTPLMGRDIPKFNTATGKMDPGSWNGDKGYLKMSRALPVTTEQHKALDELGYSNFVDYVSSNPDYLRKLGYFAAPPRTWDQASGCLYMLPPSCTKVAGSDRSVTSVSTPVVDGAGSTVWGYAQSFDDYDFTIEEPDYLAIGWQTVTNTVAGPEAFYDSSLGIGAYTDGQVLLHTNGVPFAYYVVVDTTALKLYPVMQLVNTTTTETYTPSNVVLTAGRYVGTDPRLWDTDEDGMDDYWELFHGLNPILGYVGDGEGTIVSNGTFTATLLTLSNAKDIIYNAYGSVSAWRNGWIGWDNIERPTYDPIRYPWMMGEGLCDADGDGLRNEEEALAANLTEPLTYHTDPTPLWMTDATGSYTNRSGHLIYDVVTTNGDTDVSFFVPGGAGTPSWSVVTNTYTNATASVTLMSSPSYTGLFYDYAALLGGATGASATGSNFGFSSSEYAFSFEQNEGYDTDNDWRSDSIEMKNTVEGTSDPLDVGDVQRRQSLWFGGSAKPGAAISYTPTVRNVHAYDLFRQFTVEAWVRSENPASGADQYIVSRASNYPGWDVSHTNGVIRMNFALGVDATGKAFAEMQDSAEATFRLEGTALSPNVWTHVAASYDGSTFKVYVNGEEMASTAASLMPANGVTSIQQDPQYSGAFPYEEFTYNVAPSITILGARACGEGAFDVKNAAEVTGWGDVATNFFNGSVSEVRMWDGARKPADIAGDFKVRYTTAKVKELRDTVCAQYIKGARRNTGDLDTELVQHYGMDSLPGGTEEKFVQLVPAGFKANVLDAVRNPDTGVVTTGDELAIGWWGAIVTNATLKPVYSSPHVVPWVENTVGHLPKTCGAVADSVYWSEHFAGYTPAAFHELDSYSFANTMDPYGVVNTRDEARYSYQKYNKLVSYPGGGATSDDNRRVYRLERYDSNKGFSGTTDLLPLGSAFAKRLTESWDGMGPEDAWSITSTNSVVSVDGDPDDSGMPNWAITAGYTTAKAYKAALEDGLLPGGSFDQNYTIYATDNDTNGNGIPDWWERHFDIFGCDADADFDNDGLSNYQEYLISFGNYATLTETNATWQLNVGQCRNKGMPTLDPTNPHSTGAAVTDYFLKPDFSLLSGVSHITDKTYLGEMVTDHDFMEMWWERENGLRDSNLTSYYSNPFVYDPHLDLDGDGWSNYAEARAYSWHGGFIADLIDSYLLKRDEDHILHYPQPAIGVNVTYNGKGDYTSKTLVVRTRTSADGRVDATLVAEGYEQTSSDNDGGEGSQLIGIYPGATTLHGFMNPGYIIPSTSVRFDARPVVSETLYHWHCTECNASGTTLYPEYNAHVLIHEKANEETGELGVVLTGTSLASDYASFAHSEPLANARTGRILLETATSSDKVYIGTIDYITGEYSLDLAKAAENGCNLKDNVLRVSWTFQRGQNWPQTVWLSQPISTAATGRIKEGKNTIEAFIDLNLNNLWDEGEPYGMVKDVDIGWHKTGEAVDIELRDESPIMKRTPVTFASEGDTEGGDSENGFATAKVVVRRKAINGVTDGVPVRTLASTTAISDDRAYITEADVLTANRPDLDWDWLAKDAERMGWTVDNATYDVERVDTLDDGTPNFTVLGTFTRTFNAKRAVPSALSPIESDPVYAARPTFTFQCGDETMSAYRLQVAGEGGAVVWDSGAVGLPARVSYTTENGATYRVSPELYVDTFATTNGTPVLLDGSNYQWRVALLNAKFKEADTNDVNQWSAWAKFQMDVRNKNQNPDVQTGYGNAAVAVRYYGAGTMTDTATSATNIIVEAYASADFTGIPLARMRVEDLTLLASTNDIATTNVALRGLPPGEIFLVAFVDANNNGKRDKFESWGYANYVGEDTKFIYKPKAVEVTNSTVLFPSAAIFIEDTDINQNEIPDFCEDASNWRASDRDRDGLSDSEESDLGTTPSMWDTDGDGMPDGWEVRFASLDPTLPDGGEVVVGDVMAYAEVERIVITLDTDEGDKFYVIDGESVPQVGDLASSYSCRDTYGYGDMLGLGTNVTFSGAAKIATVEARKIAFVHAQVYEAFGFNPMTANPMVGESSWVNTKAFTAFDKYLVVRYLEALGLADEVAMNTNGTWSSYTLKPGDVDSNKDGIADGWELYTMFGPAGVPATLAAAQISPWKTAAYVRNAANTPDAGGLAILDEYDCGNTPTDPWMTDTDGNGIPDADEFAYNLKTPASKLADDDHDGLSNWAEYLATQAGYGNFDVRDPYSVNAGVLDYFVKTAASLYVGEALDAAGTHLIADHDFMEDSVEDELGFNRYVFDANRDLDGNGWDNWSEARGRYDKGSWVLVGSETNSVQHVFYREWRVDQIGQYYLADSPEYIAWQATNTATIVATKYMFVNGAIADTWGGMAYDNDGNGTWVYASGVYKGHYTIEPIAYVVTVLETMPIMAYGGRPRPNIDLTVYGMEGEVSNLVVTAKSFDGSETMLTGAGSVTADGAFTGVFTGEGLCQGLNTFVVTSGDKIGFVRDVNVGYNGASVEMSLGVSDLYVTFTASEDGVARVVRTAINGTETARKRTLWRKAVATGEEVVLTPADLIRRGSVDFDSRFLVSDAATEGIDAADIKTVTYSVFVGDSEEAVQTFTRTFMAASILKPADITGDLGYKVLSAQPEFVWTGADDYSAFALQIASDTAFSTVVYATTNAVPALRADGCHFKPAAYVGKELLDNTKYYWRVAPLNATTVEPVWSVATEFETAVAINTADTGYGAVAADVRYYGPATVGDVIVAAYASPDFAGEPAAVKKLATAVTGLAYTATPPAEWTDVNANVTLEGLKPGEWYVMAFVDVNGDGKRQPYETWGYVNKIATEAADKWTPVALTAKTTKEAVDIGLLVMEDTDVNQTFVPDCLEDMSNWRGAGGSDADGDGLTDSEEDAYGADSLVWDTDGDGMPDGWELFFGNTDPLVEDADYVIDDDVMAYAEVDRTVVTIGGQRYVVVGDAVPQTGDLASAYPYMSTYAYGDMLGIGTNVTISGTARINSVEQVPVVLVHAQVYDKFGYNPLTANPTVDEETRVNTKAFTALDKYLVVRYLEALGLADEVAMNTNGTWSAYTLKPGDVDTNRDGVADGWELYVMFGDEGIPSAITGAKVSPWTDAAYVRDPANTPDGGGLSILDEFNRGIAPTDPWRVDTDGDGINDKAAREFFFVKDPDDTEGRTGYRGDYDNDQLSNLIEYLISGLTNFPDVVASKMETFNGQLVPDYFLKHGSLYLGEMFTDHDMIEDWWEDENDSYSRYNYNGKDSWAEARKAIAGITNSPTAMVTLSYRGVSSLTSTQTVTVVAWHVGKPSLGKPDAKWVVAIDDLDTGSVKFQLGEPSEGRLREGRNLFAAWVGDGDFTPGKPYGVAANVDVGYMSVEPFAIELTDVDFSTFRINLKEAIARQNTAVEAMNELIEANDSWWERVQEDYDYEAKEYADILKSCFDDVVQFSARRQFAYDAATVYKPDFFGTNTTVAASNNIRVWLTQMLINDETKTGYYKKLPSDAAPVMFNVNLDDHPVITEADMLYSLGTLDLGWDTLVPSYLTATPKPATSKANLTNAVFAVIFEVNPVSNYFDRNNGLVVEIKNHYEKGTVQTAVSDREYKVENDRPVFSWKHENTIGKMYPAFQLRVWTKTGTLVFDTGATRVPARSADGVYTWAAPIWPGMVTPTGHIFEPNTEYYWDVSMLDAKFTTPIAYTAAACATFALPNNNALLSDSGSIAVAVKYMGPASTAVAPVGASVADMIRVEAFGTPDFCGMPLASAYVRTNDTIAATNVVAVNALLTGLLKGREYYVKAYIDTNGDGVQDEWESWGYGNYVGDGDRRDVYTPRAYGVAVEPNDELKTPTAVVYIEDADTNGNKMPDAWEYGMYGSLGTTSATANEPFIVTIDTPTSSATATNVFYVIEKDVIDLPYYSALTEIENGGTLSAPSLALAMSGVDLTALAVSPKVTILDFSPTTGLSLEIDTGAKLNGATLAATPVSVSVQIDVTVEYVTSLAAAWAPITGSPFSTTVSLTAGKQTFAATDPSLATINGAITTFAVSNPTAFFRVKAVKAVHQ